MCILSGCDFLAGLQGIGVRKAHGYVRKYKGFVKVRCNSSQHADCVAQLPAHPLCASTRAL